MKEKKIEFNGALLIDKPSGISSHDVVAKLRYILKQKRIGHTGTLDPFATGLLVICLGRSTRLAQFLSAETKEYEAIVRFGFSTDTQDYTGKPISPFITSYGLKEVDWTLVLSGFLGEQWQIPPMFSAKKIAGETLYTLARKGQEVERQAVKIYIHHLEQLKLDDQLLRFNADGSCDVGIKVKCSAGTYIRTLAHDLGAKLGYGAHLVALRRTAIGNLSIINAKTLEQINEIYQNDKVFLPIITPNELVGDLPVVNLADEQVIQVRNGQTQYDPLVKTLELGSWVKLLDADRNLVSMAQVVEQNLNRKLQPKILVLEENDLQ